MELLSEAERIIVEVDVPLVPVFHYATIYMFDPHKVTGLSTHPRTKQNAFLIDMLGDGKGPDQPRPMHAPASESEDDES